MNRNNTWFYYGYHTAIVAILGWVLISVSDIQGDIKLIKYQVEQNSQDLADLKDSVAWQNHSEGGG